MPQPSDKTLLELEVASDKIVRNDLSRAVNAVTLVRMLFVVVIGLCLVVWRVGAYVGAVDNKIDAVNRRGKANARYSIETRGFVRQLWEPVYHQPLPPTTKPAPSTNDKEDRDGEED